MRFFPFSPVRWEMTIMFLRFFFDENGSLGLLFPSHKRYKDVSSLFPFWEEFFLFFLLGDVFRNLPFSSKLHPGRPYRSLFSSGNFCEPFFPSNRQPGEKGFSSPPSYGRALYFPLFLSMDRKEAKGPLPPPSLPFFQ